MDNQYGVSNIAVQDGSNSGAGSVMNIGLQDLAFNNEHGQRNINVKDLTNSGERSTINVGQSTIDNNYGVSNIAMGTATNSGYGSVMNIGLLQNLQAQGGQHNINVDAVNSSAMKGQVNVGTSALKKGETQNIHIGNYNSNGFKTHDTIGAKGGEGHQNIQIGKITAAGMDTVMDIWLL